MTNIPKQLGGTLDFLLLGQLDRNRRLLQLRQLTLGCRSLRPLLLFFQAQVQVDVKIAADKAQPAHRGAEGRGGTAGVASSSKGLTEDYGHVSKQTERKKIPVW